MSELKGCVMCGGEHRKLMGYDIHKVSCKSEGCPISHLALTPEQWNTRTTDDQLTTITKQRDELLKCLDVVNAHAVYRAGTFSSGETVAQYASRVLSTIKEQKDAK